MINLTNNIQVTKEGKELSLAVINAVENAKQCVITQFFAGQRPWPTPNQITAGSQNRFKRASIIKFFHQHGDLSIAPEYNEKWIEGLYSAATKTPKAELILRLIPNQTNPKSLTNRTFSILFKQDAILILHFLWFEGAVLLPATLQRPVTRNEETGGQIFEYAANDYPETLALARYPFMGNIRRKLVKLTDFLPSTSHDNFDWYAWRFIRATDWHVVEDINVDDVVAYLKEFTENSRKSQGIPNYPISPKAILGCFKEAFPSRCKFSMDDPQLVNTRRLATESAIQSGSFYVPESLGKHKKHWLYFERKFLKRLKTRGVNSWKGNEKELGILNAFLFEEIPSKTSKSDVPMPAEFSRRYIEDLGELPNIIDYVQNGRKPSTVRSILLTINQFFDYLESNSNTYEELKDFRNPLSSAVDFPILSNSNSTSKAVFVAEHFIPLHQFCYAIEAFGWFLAENIYEPEYAGNRAWKQRKIKKYFDSAQMTYNTEDLGFVPLVFLRNPEFDEKKPLSKKNRRMKVTPIYFIPKGILPLKPRRLKGHLGFTNFPTLNHIQQTVVALETGIRNVHIRWLDRRTYDKNIDRSYPLPPICNLWVNTDKAHGEWGARVSRSVIEMLDRQKQTHDWLEEPVIHEEQWYNNYDETTTFGKILTLFPRGLSSGTGHETKPGPSTDAAHSKNFRRTVFAFDLFCRYSLGIKPSNRMPEEFREIDSVDTMENYSRVLELFSKAKKLIEHTPHSCRASVVSHWITILPPNIIGDYITGHSTVEHVLFYAKCDPSFLKRHEKYQKLAFENGFTWDESNISSIKAEDINSTLHRAFTENKEGAVHDFGAISFERPTSKGDILSGIRELKKQPLDAISFHGTHICPFADQCPKDVIDDLNAIPGVRMPCGSCYYSVKTVDHLPRISGHVRSLIEESAELKDYIDDARDGGADLKSLESKAQYRKFLADEISAWTVTMLCLDQMYQDIQSRDHFLVQQPEIVKEQLQRVVVDDVGLENLMARVAEAKTHSEFFTPRLKSQLKLARAKILKRSGDIHRLLEDEPKGFTLLDEFRGIIRSTCETLGLNLKQLTEEIDKPALINFGGSDKALKLIFKAEVD